MLRTLLTWLVLSIATAADETGDRTQRWEAVRLPDESSVHRMAWVKVEYRPKSPGTVEAVPAGSAGSARPSMEGRLKEYRHKWLLVAASLHGRSDGSGAPAGSRILAYQPPAQLDDRAAKWSTQLIAESADETHDFHTTQGSTDGSGVTSGLFIASRAGVKHYFHRMDERWFIRAWPEDRIGAEGVGEVCSSHSGRGQGFLATIEPVHGNRLVVYAADTQLGGPLYEPGRMLTDRLAGGSALECDDLLDTGSDQIVVGWRGNPSQAERGGGIKIFTSLDPSRQQWRESTIDDGAMACHDLQLADLNGDGKLDIVACGHATRNVKVYLNESY